MRFYEHERGWGAEAPYQRLLRIGRYQPGNWYEHYPPVPEMRPDIAETQRLILAMAVVHRRTIEATYCFHRDPNGYLYDREKRARELLRTTVSQYDRWLGGARRDFQRRLKGLRSAKRLV